jgi:asparagine synthase (glutamine-hydrolysing)
MCAICGIVNFHDGDFVDGVDIVNMTASLVHRGPDDDGHFVEGRVGLGFRRLSVIDLSGGKQPIFNEDESAAIVFNGEIYNYRDLASRLRDSGHVFRTRSDTETILHAWEQYGEDCVDHLRGMFAFAIWDRARQRLLLARDRLGIKPLYYYRNNRFLAFASEIKALLEIPGVPHEVDPEAFDMYLSLRYVPGPRTMFRDIFRLQPGHILTLDETGMHTRKYWDVQYREPEPLSPEYFRERFRDLLEESVRLRLVSEVPLGVFLSGGLDSSAILATMSKVGAGFGGQTRGLKTFSVGYEAPDAQGEEANEFEYARLAAKTFGADHHEYRLTADEFQQFVPSLVWHLDEPLADPSCIPLYFISRLAREHVTVVLSGEGADETLAGYNIYRRMLALDGMNRSLPGIQHMTPWLSRLAPSAGLRNYVRMSGLPLNQRYRGVCRGLTRECQFGLVGHDRLRHAEEQLQSIFGEHFSAAAATSPLNQMLYVDAKVWLPDDLLNKADKMTMATGLELRVPFLDHKMVEFAATLPQSAKLGGKGGKTLLRNAMRGVLPDTIIDRPKKGFPVPISSWLRGSMSGFARENLLASDAACGRFMDRQAVATIVEDHVSARADRSQEIWTLLVFEFWHRHFAGQRIQRRRAA